MAKASDCKSDIVGSTPTDASQPPLRWSTWDCFAAAFLLVLAHRGKRLTVLAHVQLVCHCLQLTS